MVDKTYDVFICFNSQDRCAVEKIAIYLNDCAGIRPWLDSWELIPGEPDVANFERGLKACSTCAVFVGGGGQGPWQKREVAAALSQQVKNPDFRVIPVLLPTASIQPELPLFLSGNMWVKFPKEMDDDALWRLECGIRGMPPGRGRPVNANSGVPPMNLELESGEVFVGVTEQQILEHVNGQGFAILSINPESFVQCAPLDSSTEFVLEFHTPPDLHIQTVEASGRPLTLDIVQSVFIRHLRGDLTWLSDFNWNKTEI